MRRVREADSIRPSESRARAPRIGTRVAFPPTSLETFYKVVAINFGIMKVAFLGVIAYLAWVIPRPLKIPQP